MRNFILKLIIAFTLGSWFLIHSMGIRDYLTMIVILGVPIGLAYLYDYLKKRKKTP